MSIRITHCICYDVPFVRLKQVAEKHGCRSIDELQLHIEFGKRCRLCHPYVRQMLATGQTVFHSILTDSAEEG